MQKSLLQHGAGADSLLILFLALFYLSIRARSQLCGSSSVLSALTNPCCTLLQRTWCWYRHQQHQQLHGCPEHEGCRCQEPCFQVWLCFPCMPLGNPVCHKAALVDRMVWLVFVILCPSWQPQAKEMLCQKPQSLRALPAWVSLGTASLWLSTLPRLTSGSAASANTWARV